MMLKQIKYCVGYKNHPPFDTPEEDLFDSVERCKREIEYRRERWPSLKHKFTIWKIESKAQELNYDYL